MPANILSLKKPTGGKWAIAAAPVIDKYHLVYVGENNNMDTGRPIVVYADTPQEVCDLLFSEYSLKEIINGVYELESYVVRDVLISTGYQTEAEAQEFADDAMEEVEGLLMRPIKHPARDEWSLGVSSHILNTKGKQGPRRSKINDKIADQAVNGRHKSPAQAAAEGWAF